MAPLPPPEPAPPPAPSATEAGVKGWQDFQLEQATTCVGAADEVMAAPAEWTHEGFRYRIEGGRAGLSRVDASPHPGVIKLGVVSGIKEPDPATLKVLEGFLATFAEAKVDAVLVGGDSGFSGMELEKVFRALGQSGLPILAIAGNNESRSKYNRALRAVSADHPNVLNQDIVRVVQGQGFGVVSLPGYHLKAFASTSASCVHDDDDIKALEALLASVEGERVLLSHGPPKQQGKAGTDWVDQATGNVGNELLTRVLQKSKPRLTVTGHILESGLRATDAKGKPAAPGKPQGALVLNPGQVSALPYQLSSGQVIHGTGALVTVQGGKIHWKILEGPKP
ncbi:MAG: metallophosphoesterase family protein [Deltaproteobacteria bacterium]|nr:metallophosphoesterase family protein [Deltaproteobacteria bacterium]